MRQVNTAKTIAESVLTTRKCKELWTASYPTVLPFTPSHFALEAVLPAVMYMFRWGHRRGTGQFAQRFSPEGSNSVSAQRVAEVLSSQTDVFKGFANDIPQAVLADMLLAYCLENKSHAVGRSTQVIRVFPTHYFASWIDLPPSVGHLRSVPEMLVALLTDQKEGMRIEPGKVRSRFSTGQGFDNNELLRHFAKGVVRTRLASDVTADEYDESTEVGIDQLLTIRMARHCGASPNQLRGESATIPNRHPLAMEAANTFRSDFTTFLEAYGDRIPRQALLSMLESCISVGITNIFLSSALMVLDWERTNSVPEGSDKESPWPLFVDASLGEDNDLRRVAEESFDECLRRLDRLPMILMAMRVLEQAVSEDEDLAAEVRALKTNPSGAPMLNLLGSIRSNTHDSSQLILRDLKKVCAKLAEAFEAEEEQAVAVEILRNTDVDPATRLGESLVILMGDDLQRGQFVRTLDSGMMANLPNGLGRRRKVFISASGRRRMTEARSVVLTNTMLDFLVHRHLRRGKRGKKEVTLSLLEFLRILRERYGLYVDRSPAGLTIPTEMLLRNKVFLERRLRDLGLLVGVNDAESMKRLVARFDTEEKEDG